MRAPAGGARAELPIFDALYVLALAPEPMTKQPRAIKANQRAIRVIDVLVAKIDDL